MQSKLRNHLRVNKYYHPMKVIIVIKNYGKVKSKRNIDNIYILLVYVRKNHLSLDSGNRILSCTIKSFWTYRSAILSE